MIRVIFGDDIKSSYEHLSNILKNRPDFLKIWLGNTNKLEELHNNLFSDDFFKSPKIIICEDWIKNKKIYSKDIAKIPESRELIFYEKGKITPSSLNFIRNKARLEEFKLRSTIFQFLDGLSPNLERTLNLLFKLNGDNYQFLLWNLQKRETLLILQFSMERQ